MPALHVASPSVVVGLANGSLWLHCGDTDQGLFSDDLALFRTFSSFARPADPDAVVDAAADPDAARRHVAELVRVGALVPSEPAPAAEPSPGELVGQVLTPLAIAVDDLAGTLCAVSPEVAESVRTETGLGLRARLMACLAAVQAVRQGVGSRAPAFVAAQLSALDLPDRGLNIHVGSGSKRLDGWVNLDVWPAELSLDLRAGLPFGDASAERVYLSHTLEHMVYPREVMGLLREIHRVLEPGGRVRIVVPDIGAAIDAYVAKDTRFFEGRKEVWPEWKITTRLESFLGYAGVGPYPGMFGYSHKFGYDEETLSRVLTEAGFRGVARSSFQGSPDPTLHVDHASTYAVAHVDGRYYSLFMEAVK